MAHLLHLDSSLRIDGSRSRTLSAYFAERWQAAQPGGVVTYRDLTVDPVPHLDSTSFFAFADTVVARSYAGGNECHGWMGVRF